MASEVETRIDLDNRDAASTSGSDSLDHEKHTVHGPRSKEYDPSARKKNIAGNAVLAALAVALLGISTGVPLG